MDSQSFIIDNDKTVASTSLILHVNKDDVLIYGINEQGTCFAFDQIDINNIDNSNMLALPTITKSSAYINTDDFTLIPNALFEEEHKATYATFNFNLKEDYKVLTSKLTKYNLTICYAINEIMFHKLNTLVPGIQFNHYGKPLIESIDNEFHVHFVGKNQLEITVSERNTLLFYNRFYCNNKEESLYYLSLVLEKLNKDIKLQPFVLSGNINSTSEIYNFWKTYIPEKNIKIYQTDKTKWSNVLYSSNKFNHQKTLF